MAASHSCPPPPSSGRGWGRRSQDKHPPWPQRKAWQRCAMTLRPTQWTRGQSAGKHLPARELLCLWGDLTIPCSVPDFSGKCGGETAPGAHTAPSHLPKCSFRSFGRWRLSSAPGVRSATPLACRPDPAPDAPAQPGDTPTALPSDSSPSGAMTPCPLSLGRKSLS